LTTAFIGVDLGWYGKPSGLASVRWDGVMLRQRAIARLESADEILEWVESEIGEGSAVAAIDAPLVIRNESGIRNAERHLNRDFRRYHAGCHAANLGRPFARNVVAFSARLQALGFLHGGSMKAREPGRFQIEVHPHAAAVRLFELDRIVKYKKGRRAERAAELNRLRTLMTSRLPECDPPLRIQLPRVPEAGRTKIVEDQIDAVLCAYVAAHWWFWGAEKNTVYGDNLNGYIVVPGKAGGILPTL
jgi:predicted RNase H-like nuclease